MPYNDDDQNDDMGGARDRQRLLDAGADPVAVNTWQQQETQKLIDAGAQPSAVERYWGKPNPDTTKLDNLVSSNLSHLSEDGQGKVAENFTQSVAAGWQHGDIGVALSKPEYAEHGAPGVTGGIGYSIGQAAGDLPAMVAGLFGGGAAGPVGAAVGSMAVPEAFRQIMMDQYNHPEGLRNVKELWDRSTEVAWNTIKAGAMGAAMGPGASLGASIGEKVIGGALARGVGSAVGMTAAVEGTGDLLNWQAPSFQSLATAGAMIVGFHVAGTVVGATGRFVTNAAGDAARRGVGAVYAETGLQPEQIVDITATDPGLAREAVAPFAPSGEPNITGFPKTPEPKAFEEPKAAELGKLIKENPATPAGGGGEGEQQQEEVLKVETDKGLIDDLRPAASAALEKTLGAEYNKAFVDHNLATLPEDLITRVDDMMVAQQEGVMTARAWIQGGRNIRDLPIHTQRILEQAESQGSTEDTSYVEKLDTSLAEAGGVNPADLPASEAVTEKGKMVRLYRGETNFPNEPRSPPPEYMLDDPDFQKSVAAEGRWFVKDRKIAEYYNKTFGDKTGRVSYIDVPSDEVEQYLADRNPEARRFSASGRALEEYFVSRELADSRKPSVEPSLREDIATVRTQLMPPSEKEGWFAPFKDWRNLFTMPASQFTPARTLDLEHGVEAGQSGIERILRMGLLGARSHIQSILQYGPLEPVPGKDWDYQPVIGDDGKPLRGSPLAAYTAIKAAGGNKSDFFAMMSAGLTMEQAERGFDTGVDFNAALRVWKDPEMQAKYGPAIKLWREFTDGVPDLMMKEGRLAPPLADAWKRLNQTYVTIQRIQDPTFNARDATRAFGYKGIAKARTGGDAKFIDPEVSTISNAAWQIAESSRNKATLMLIEEMRKYDPNAMILKDTILPDEAEDMKPIMNNNGDMIPVAADIAPAVSQARTLQRASGRAGPDDFVAYQPDGSVEIWTAKDKNLAQIAGFHSLGDPGWGWDVLHKAADLARMGITANLGFTTRAVWHQQIAQAVTFGHGMVPFQSLIEGWSHAVGHDEVYQNWLRNGGGGTFMGIERLEKGSQLQTMFRDGFTYDNVMNVMKHPIDSLLALDHLAQEAGRVGTAKHLVENEGKTWSEAADMSRTAALDFAEKSTSNFINNWQRAVPFMNVGIKDLEQVGRAIQDNPAGFLARGFTYLTVPTLALSALNGFMDQYLPDDQKYSEIPEAYRMMFWISPPVNGHRLWMPKPYVMSMLFADPAEAFTQWAFGNRQMAPHEMLSLFGHQVLPSYMPTLAAPVYEELSNKSLLTGRPLIPDSLSKAAGYMQYTANTTEAAKEIAKLIGPTRMNIGDVSPITIQNYVQNWGGTMPMQILRVLDMAWKPPGRPWDVADLPMVGSFTRRNPGMGADSIEHFYDLVNDVTKTKETLRLAMKTGDFSQIQDAEDMQYASTMTGYTKALNNITTIIKAVNESDMPNNEKVSTSDTLSTQAIQMAKQGSELIEALKAAHEAR